MAPLIPSLTLRVTMLELRPNQQNTQVLRFQRCFQKWSPEPSNRSREDLGAGESSYENRNIKTCVRVKRPKDAANASLMRHWATVRKEMSRDTILRGHGPHRLRLSCDLGNPRTAE
jgi:hypothetical protein